MVLIVNPLLTVWLAIVGLLKGRKLFIEKEIYLQGVKQRVKIFNTDKPLLALQPLYTKVLSGTMSVAGTSIRVVGEDEPSKHKGKPGLYSVVLLRRLSRIDYESKEITDLEYLDNKSFKKDLMMLVKAMLQLRTSDPDYEKPERIRLLDVEFLNLTMNDALNKISGVIDSGQKEMFAFMNPDCFNKLFQDQEYLKLMQNCKNIFPDGSGINLACKIIKKQLVHNVNGTDMLPYLCQMAEEKGYRIFLLGAAPGVAEKMKKSLVSKYRRLIISDVEDGYFNRETESDRVIQKINDSNSQILLVAFGVPLQEKWLRAHLMELSINVGMGVGGLFDFYSGNMPRAPKWMRELGLEWVFRLLMEPKRMWRRYIIGNPLFVRRVKIWNKG